MKVGTPGTSPVVMYLALFFSTRRQVSETKEEAQQPSIRVRVRTTDGPETQRFLMAETGSKGWGWTPWFILSSKLPSDPKIQEHPRSKSAWWFQVLFNFSSLGLWSQLTTRDVNASWQRCYWLDHSARRPREVLSARFAVFWYQSWLQSGSLSDLEMTSSSKLISHRGKHW